MLANTGKRNERAEEIVKTQKCLAGNRSHYESVWRQIAERMWPSYVESFSPTGTNKIPQIQAKEMIYDSTATIALGRFGAILDSLLTPRNQTWHRLMASDPALNKEREVQLWFEDFTRALFKYRYAPKANFAAQNQQNYQSLGAFGTGCVFVDELSGEPGLRYHAVHLGEIYFRENHQGLVDTAFRYYMVKAINFVKHPRWKDKVPKVILDAAKNTPDKEFAVIHAVQPRDDIQHGRYDYKGMPFISEYITVEEPTILSENGFNSFPFAISRYEQAPGEVYGRSPGMQVLPTVKTLNEQMRSLLKQGQRAVDPVLLAYDDGVMSGFQLKSGAINYGGVNKDGRELVKALPTGRMDVGRDMINDSRATINDAFLVSLFQILVETPTATATEILEKAKEKGILLAPTIGRQQSEYLGPLIEREADLLIRQGIVPPMPQALVEAGGEYRIEYDSPLSRAMRAEEAAGLMRTLETALKVAAEAQRPEILDFFNFEEIIPDLSDIQGMPKRWLHGLKEVQAMRAERAEAQQAQQMVDGAPAAAAMMKASAAQQKVA